MHYPLKSYGIDRLHAPYTTRHPFLAQLDPTILALFSAQQLAVIQLLVESTYPQTIPKLINLRLTANLGLTRLSVGLWVRHRDRQLSRHASRSTWARIGHRVIAMSFLIGLNLTISMGLISLFYVIYRIKSALGIDLFPFHLKDLLTWIPL